MASVFDEIYDNLKKNDNSNNTNRRTSNPRVNTFIKNKEKNDSKPKSENKNNKENKNDFFTTLFNVAFDTAYTNPNTKNAETAAVTNAISTSRKKANNFLEKHLTTKGVNSLPDDSKWKSFSNAVNESNLIEYSPDSKYYLQGLGEIGKQIGRIDYVRDVVKSVNDTYKDVSNLLHAYPKDDDYVSIMGVPTSMTQKEWRQINKNDIADKYNKNTNLDDTKERIKNIPGYVDKLVDTNGKFKDNSERIKELEETIKLLKAQNDIIKSTTSNSLETQNIIIGDATSKDVNLDENNKKINEFEKELEELKQIQKDQQVLLYNAGYESLKNKGASDDELLKYKETINEQFLSLPERVSKNVGATGAQFVGNLLKAGDTLNIMAADWLGVDIDNDGTNFNQIINDAEYYLYLTRSQAGDVERVIYDIYDGMAPFLYSLALSGGLSMLSGGTTSFLGNAAAAKQLTNKALLISDMSVLGQQMKANISNGYDIETSISNALMHAALSHIVESIGADNIANIITGEIGYKLLENTAAYMSKALVNSFIAEGLEEGIEAAFEPIIDRLTLNTGLTVGEYFQQVFSLDTAYQMLIGGLGGLAMGGASATGAVIDFNSEVKRLQSEISNIETKKEANLVLQLIDEMNKVIDETEKNISQKRKRNLDVSKDENQLRFLVAYKKANQNKVNEFKIKNPYSDAFISKSDNVSLDLSNSEQFIENASRPTLANALENVVAAKQELLEKSKQALTDYKEEFIRRNAGIKEVDVDSLTNEEIGQIQFIDKVASDLNRKVSYADMVDKNGNIVDGFYDDKNKITIINPKAKDGMLSALVHEYTHGSESSQYYSTLDKLAEEYHKETTGRTFNDEIESTKELYSTIDELSDEGARKELVCKTTQKLLDDYKYIKRLVRYNTELAYRLYEDIKHSNEVSNRTISKIEYNFMKAFYDANNQVQETPVKNKFFNNTDNNLSLKYSYIDTNDTDVISKRIIEMPNGKTIVDIGDIKKDSNGNEITDRQVYRSLIGKKLILKDGSKVELVSKINGKRIIDEVLRKYPYSESINDTELFKGINKHINQNIKEALYDSLFEENEAQKHDHSSLGIVDFDRRTVNVLYNGSVYTLKIKIANLLDGRKIGYAKSNIEINKELTNEYKKMEGGNTIQPSSNSKLPTNDVIVNNLTQKEIDIYNKAIKSGDMETAQRIVNKAAENTGYSSNSDYQGTSAFNGTAPSNQGWYNSIDAAIEAWNNDEFEGPATLGMYKKHGIDINNLDFFLNDNRAYRNGNNFTRESIANLRDVINNDKDTITMYRSVPVGIKENSFRNGDWITPSKSYAEDNASVHSDYPGWENGYRIIEQEVPIDDIWWDGNDINEWGYDDGNNYAYKNTPNNIKSLDTVTYDENGNPVPIEQRFDESKSDIQFSLGSEKAIERMKKSSNPDLQELGRTIQNGINNAKLDSILYDMKPKELFENYGVLIGKDGKWRFEIIDNLAAIEKNMPKKDGTYKLIDIYPLDNNLFEIYPELKNVDVIIEKKTGNKKGQYKGNAIYIYNNSGKTLLHELQHAIQHIEKMDSGTSLKSERRKLIDKAVANFLDFNIKESIKNFKEAFNEKIIRDRYLNNYGEVEARDVAERAEKRMNGTNLDRVRPAVLDERIAKKIDKYYNDFNVKKNRKNDFDNNSISFEPSSQTDKSNIEVFDRTRWGRVDNTTSNKEETTNTVDTEMQRLAEEVSHREGVRRSLEKFTDDSGMVKNFFGIEGQALTLNELEDSALKTIDDAKEGGTRVLDDQERKSKDTGKKDLNTLLRKVTNKGKAFWDLSRKHGDNIYALYNNFMNANRQAEYNINKKDGLVDIINKIPSELQNDFGYYMYHLLNVDAAKLNKNVYYDFDSNQSKQVANQYEKEHPEFVKVRDEIYKYEKDLRDMLVKSGRITQNTANKWEQMYPHYVHVVRDIVFDEDGTNARVQSSNKGTVNDRTGGKSNLKSLHDALVEQTRQVYKSVALNELAREYSKLTDKKTQFFETRLSLDGQLEEMGKELREADEYNPATLVWYDNGDTHTIEIPDDVYEALKPSEYMDNAVTRTLEKANNFRRNLITGKNPMFMVRNIFKDSQDVLYKSEHPIATYGQLLNPKTAYELATNTGLAERWHELGGGLGNFTEVHTGNKFYNNTIGLIERANNFTESLPRYAEFKASLLKGRTETQAMYDSDKVTTNFKMGGELTKQADRLGATFLNASVEGFTELVQTYERAYDKNGIKGIASKMALSTLVYSLPLMVLNHLMWKDDKDYEELSDYIKDNYYIVGKVGNRFIRIPKGRIAAAYQSVINAFIKDGKVIASDKDGKTKAKELWDNTLDSIVSVWDNIGVNNPLTNNLFSPLVQVANNKTWYGDDLLSEYELRKEPSEQYDYSTDELSKWVGANLNLSPKKINYLLDQYSGGIGDVVLPMLTPKAETALDDGSIGGMIGSALASPWVDAFSTDPVFKNQNVSDLFTLDEELSKAASKENATDEEKLASKYITSIKYKMFDLYGERAKIYNDKSLTDAEKYSRARDIQNEINDLARLGNNTYDQVDLSGNYGEINGYGYYKDSEGSWKKVDSKTMDEMNGLSMTSSQRDSFYNLKSSINDSDKDKNTKVNEILNSNLSDEQKNYVYDKYYSSKTGDYINTLDLSDDKKVSLKNAVSTAQGVKDSNGKTISNSKALAVADAYADEGVLDDVFDYIKKNGLNPSEFGLSKTVMNYSYNQMSKAYEQVFGQAFGNGENQQLSSGYSGSSNGSKSYKKQQKAMIKFAQGLSSGNSSNVFSGLNDILSSATSIDDVKKKIKEIQKKYS